MYCIIVGGGNVGYYLTKDLAAAGHEVLLLEKNRARAAQLVEELGDIAAQGDGCEVRVMEEVGFGRADIVVAVTGEDEDNLVVCQMAKRKFSTARTIARVNSPINEPIFAKLGIDTTVSSTRIIFNLIEQEIESDQVVPVAALAKGSLEIVQVELSTESAFLGKPVAGLALPPGALIAAVIRSDTAQAAVPGMVFLAGDVILILVAADKEAELRRVFASG